MIFPRAHARQGFTILEVMIAVTIFALVSVVIFVVFRSAVKSQEAADRGSQNIERARFVMDSLRRDTANIFFRDETSYNIAATSLIENMEQLRLQAEESGDWSQFNSVYGDPSDPESEKNASIGNPYEKVRVIDLQFVGTDSGDVDTMTFSATTPLKRGATYHPWGVGRITYKVDGSWLVRTVDTIETEKRDVYGTAPESKPPPDFVKLAEGVKKFNITYAFWYDNQWYEVPSWNSASRQIRNPRYVLGAYDELTDKVNSSGLSPGQDGFNNSLNDQFNEPLDRLPAYIRVTLEFADLKNPARVEDFESIIRIFPAEETYTPSEELTEDIREEERNLRDSDYVPVFPGTMRKQ
ncbi:prepilin-type N-terminal cleavage/methylation domain-containing protein [Candidatus Sumerlaeota bacterium]|nr:prepilin-type N-terminal cleavage/methylation domain-containing protein [Candidatus Sumerlaeota bacterium]